MTLTAIILSLALQTQAINGPTVQYYQQSFQIHAPGDIESVPLTPAEAAGPKSVAFRKNEAFAVWDERGLTVRRGGDAVSSRMPEVAVSPRVFPREEILRTLQRIRDGECTKEAAALSGARRIGKDAFFLLRWVDNSGKSWAEALIQVDLTALKLSPHLVGRFAGISSATKDVDDKLMIVQGKLAIIGSAHDSWGLDTYDPSTQQFDVVQMGAKLESILAISSTQSLFVETSTYGSTIAGRIDIETGTRKILYEGRERATFLDTSDPVIVIARTGTKTKLINCSTGAVRLIPYDIDARRVGKDILLWWDPSSPTAAWLISPTSWVTLAIWRAN